jgi:hypothetical protein
MWDAILPAWLALLTEFLSRRPFSRINPEGVRSCLTLTSELLTERGFKVAHHANPSPDGAGILIACREPRGGCAHTVGLFAHVDVENVRPSQLAAWKSQDPLVPELLSGRYYCRGIADNLGPFLARLLAFRASDECSAGVVWVIQGEEETGSHFAHTILPTLRASPELASVMLWIEETGYFLADGAQRVLCMHGQLEEQLDSAAPLVSSLPIVDFVLRQLAAHAGDRRTVIQQRFLNKSFGSNRCPCIEHLIDGRVPYMSFGINDVLSCIHDTDESVPVGTLGVAFEQFKAALSLPAAAAAPPSVDARSACTTQ